MSDKTLPPWRLNYNVIPKEIMTIYLFSFFFVFWTSFSCCAIILHVLVLSSTDDLFSLFIHAFILLKRRYKTDSLIILWYNFIYNRRTHSFGWYLLKLFIFHWQQWALKRLTERYFLWNHRQALEAIRTLSINFFERLTTIFSFHEIFLIKKNLTDIILLSRATFLK